VTTHTTARRARRAAEATAGAVRNVVEVETLKDNMTNNVIEFSLRQMMTQLTA